MRIFIFKSDANGGLQAFTGDIEGRKLPDQFRPWTAVGVIAADKAPPHNLSRNAIEQAIARDGYQLWRMKQKAAQTAVG